MKLNLACLGEIRALKDYRLPAYDVAAVAAATKAAPVWLHFGAGNIFRAFLAASAQEQLNAGRMDRGVLCCETTGDETTMRCLRPHDNLTIAVSLLPEGGVEKELVASIAESLTLLHDRPRVEEVVCAPSLQMLSFTITEKSYQLRDAQGSLLPGAAADLEAGPANCRGFLGSLAALLLARCRSCGAPLALVSMDNFSRNGEQLQKAVLAFADAWKTAGKMTAAERAWFAEKLSFPWSVIDKITPRPSREVEKLLEEDGFTDMAPLVTAKGTHVAPFVNAEPTQYLVVEDDFPNGRPNLDGARGVLFSDRETVSRVERMKVCTCLNPLHTALAIFGCLLGCEKISDEMADRDLRTLVERMSAEEGMPVVTDPGVISPPAFLEEVLNRRFPNPFLPDTPQRIATDTSQKLAIRFGETLKEYAARGEDAVKCLRFIPFVLAGWLRYLLALDDGGRPFALSDDPLLPYLQEQLAGISLGQTTLPDGKLRPLLSNSAVFGLDLTACGLAERVEAHFLSLLAGPGAVRRVLHEICETEA